ncbi:hypothetical protein INT48_007462 [Thamnidium elegans]|uniref:C2H2-type domain-containing protein n=1 Tax=Thamnidium elegans TaxID=101142 RepID=A0A8H7VUC8_9FUNG|nr:hypothetical protein INT48_007462 [Thamnidium elegans]
MVFNIYPDMSYNYQTHLYQHGSTSNSLQKQPMHTENLLTSYNQPMIMNSPSQYPSTSTSHSFIPNHTVNTQPQYYYQPWKISRTSNELMLSHENMVPYCQRNIYNESGMSVDSSYQQQQFNNMYSFGQEKHHFSSSSSLSSSSSSPPPPPPVSSTSTSMYNNTQPCVSNNKTVMYEPNHYRRSSINTSRSSSPSFHDSFISRSPSPVNNKRYSCRLCSKRFTRPSSLTTHIYSHTGEKPFKCAVEGCGRNFSVVSNLRRHAKVHGNNPCTSPSISTTTSTSTSTAYSF